MKSALLAAACAIQGKEEECMIHIRGLYLIFRIITWFSHQILQDSALFPSDHRLSGVNIKILINIRAVFPGSVTIIHQFVRVRTQAKRNTFPSHCSAACAKSNDKIHPRHLKLLQGGRKIRQYKVLSFQLVSKC